MTLKAPSFLGQELLKTLLCLFTGTATQWFSIGEGAKVLQRVICGHLTKVPLVSLAYMYLLCQPSCFLQDRPTCSASLVPCHTLDTLLLANLNCQGGEWAYLST